MTTSPIIETVELGFPWVGLDPFIMTVHHVDHYPAGDAQLGPVASLASTRQDMQASFSPDGRQVAFLSNRGGANQIWVASWPGGRPAPVPTGNETVLAFDWAPRHFSDDSSVRTLPR